jgi:hypothetical protein
MRSHNFKNVFSLGAFRYYEKAICPRDVYYIVVDATRNINHDHYASQTSGGQTMDNNSTGIYLGMDEIG